MSSSRRRRNPIFFVFPGSLTVQWGVVDRYPPTAFPSCDGLRASPATFDAEVGTAFRDRRVWVRKRPGVETRQIVAMSEPKSEQAAEEPSDETTEGTTGESTEKGSSEGAQAAKGSTSPSDVSLPDLRRLMDGSGSVGCEQCGGAGQIECVVCEGKGMLSLVMMDTTSASTCRLCQGRRIIPCPSCRSEVFRSVLWWDEIPSQEEDPEGKWRDGPDGPRIKWGSPPNEI